MHSVLTGTPKLPETLDKLNAQIDSIHTLDERNKHQVYNKKENRKMATTVPTPKNLQLIKLYKKHRNSPIVNCQLLIRTCLIQCLN